MAKILQTNATIKLKNQPSGLVKSEFSEEEKRIKRIKAQHEGVEAELTSTFNLDNCPETYQELVRDSVFLRSVTGYASVILGQRLAKIADEELYLEEGYKDFKEFVEEKVKISRSSAYRYIDYFRTFKGQPSHLLENIEISKVEMISKLAKQKPEMAGELLGWTKEFSKSELKEKLKDLEEPSEKPVQKEGSDKEIKQLKSLLSRLTEKTGDEKFKEFHAYLIQNY